jgi:hypothetical protein
MTDFNPTERVALVDHVPTDRAALPPYRRSPRTPMTPTGPIFSRLDRIAGILAAVMTLGPLAMAAFAVGRC